MDFDCRSVARWGVLPADPSIRRALTKINITDISIQVLYFQVWLKRPLWQKTLKSERGSKMAVEKTENTSLLSDRDRRRDLRKQSFILIWYLYRRTGKPQEAGGTPIKTETCQDGQEDRDRIWGRVKGDKASETRSSTTDLLWQAKLKYAFRTDKWREETSMALIRHVCDTLLIPWRRN